MTTPITKGGPKPVITEYAGKATAYFAALAQWKELNEAPEGERPGAETSAEEPKKSSLDWPPAAEPVAQADYVDQHTDTVPEPTEAGIGGGETDPEQPKPAPKAPRKRTAKPKAEPEEKSDGRDLSSLLADLTVTPMADDEVTRIRRQLVANVGQQFGALASFLANTIGRDNDSLLPVLVGLAGARQDAWNAVDALTDEQVLGTTS